MRLTRPRREAIIMTFVLVTNGRLPTHLGELLRAMRLGIPDLSEDELRRAIRWALRRKLGAAKTMSGDASFSLSSTMAQFGGNRARMAMRHLWPWSAAGRAVLHEMLDGPPIDVKPSARRTLPSTRRGYPGAISRCRTS